MKNGICPKCGSSNVFMEEKGIQWHDGMRVITGSISWGSPKYESYVCTDFGYFENYITDVKELARVAEKWKRAKS